MKDQSTKEVKHTPEPWYRSAIGERKFIRQKSVTGPNICELNTCLEEWEENMSLILSAPETAAKLEEVTRENGKLLTDKERLKGMLESVTRERDRYETASGQLGMQNEYLQSLNSELLEALKDCNRYFMKQSKRGKWAKRLFELTEPLIARAEKGVSHD